MRRDPDVVRAPDIAFVCKERLPVAVDRRSDYVLGAPDLAVEIQSPSQSPADLQKKVQQYLAAGADAVWVIHPRKRQAVIHRPSGKPATVTAGQFLNAPNVLPGLRIPLSEIFASK
jgi:Uma2 family endonuclease